MSLHIMHYDLVVVEEDRSYCGKVQNQPVNHSLE